MIVIFSRSLACQCFPAKCIIGGIADDKLLNGRHRFPPVLCCYEASLKMPSREQVADKQNHDEIDKRSAKTPGRMETMDRQPQG
jgi:hypothetical protein